MSKAHLASTDKWSTWSASTFGGSSSAEEAAGTLVFPSVKGLGGLPFERPPVAAEMGAVDANDGADAEALAESER